MVLRKIRELLFGQNILKIFYEYTISQFPEIKKNNNICYCFSDLNCYSIFCDISYNNETNKFDFKNYNIIFGNNIDNKIKYDEKFEIIINGRGKLLNTFENIEIERINCTKIHPFMNYSIEWLRQNALPNNNKPIEIKGIKELLHEYTGPELLGEYFKKNNKVLVFNNKDSNNYFIGHDENIKNIINTGWIKYRCNNISLTVSNFGRIRLQDNMNEIINIEKMVQKKEKRGLKFDYPVLVGDDFFTIVHRLVAETFPKKLKTDPYLDFNIYKYVHHIDGNCYNNNENNLLWVTPYQHALIHPYLWNNFLK